SATPRTAGAASAKRTGVVQRSPPSSSAPGPASTASTMPAAAASATSAGRRQSAAATAPGKLRGGLARVASSSRLRAAGSTSMGCFSSAITRSSRGSRSIIAVLLEERSQPLARPLHPHPQRGQAGARDPRDLIVVQFLDVLQQERLPLLRRQRRERALDRAAEPAVRLRRHGRTVHAGRERLQVAQAALRGGRPGPAPVGEDAQQPGAELVPLAVAPERTM